MYDIQGRILKCKQSFVRIEWTQKIVCVCMYVWLNALANSNLKSCKDHVDDSHSIDLYTFISVNVQDGSFYTYNVF